MNERLRLPVLPPEEVPVPGPEAAFPAVYQMSAADLYVRAILREYSLAGAAEVRFKRACEEVENGHNTY